MYKLATAALAVALGISLSAIPAMSADDNKTLKDKAVDAKDTVKEKTSEAWDKTKETTSEAWDKAKEKTSEAWDKTKEKTVEAKDKIKAKVSGDKKESAEDQAEAARKAEGKDTVGAKVDRGVEKTKAKARETKDKIAAQTESSAEIRQGQMALKEKVHDPGPIDGIHGPRTSAALRAYPKAETIKVSGRLDADTKSHLMGQASSGATAPSASPAAPSPTTSGGSASAPAQGTEKTQKP